MPTITADDVITLGFTPEMFRQGDETALAGYIDGVITEQSAILAGRIGSTAYASASAPTKDYVKRAEKCLTAAELIQRRININFSRAVGGDREITFSPEGAQKKAYKDEADMWIDKIISGATADGADLGIGVLVTDHFST